VNQLNLFYEEPDSDRWLPLDRHVRRIIRPLVRGRSKIGGQKRVLLNLCKGLDRLGVTYRLNQFTYAASNREQTVCIIGKQHVLRLRPWKNPIVLGPAMYSHPSESPTLLSDYPNVRKIIVPGDWMRRMCEPYWGDRVASWPVGIDTSEWKPVNANKEMDFVIYDKIRWDHDQFKSQLVEPIVQQLRLRGLQWEIIRYGCYREEEFRNALKRARAMIFLCEHETQGLAYQEALSCGVPILAWDRGGYWQDPTFFPQVKFGPVSSVPYFDDRCGRTFDTIHEFASKLDEFLDLLHADGFSPRDYIMDNLTLEKCAQQYVDIVNQAASR
jgi:hypothetical protein